MLGMDLIKLCEKYPYYDFRFAFADDRSPVNGDVREFDSIDICDVIHMDREVILTGTETGCSMYKLSKRAINNWRVG